MLGEQPMKKNPVDDIIDKIIAELLRLQQIETVSQTTLNCLSEIMKSYIIEIGKKACNEASIAMRPTICIYDIVLAVSSLTKISDLNDDIHDRNLPPAFGYSTIPNSTYKNTMPVLNPNPNDLPAFLPPLPSSHLYSKTNILSVSREKDNSLNRKRLLEERHCVKKSIGNVSEPNTILWETYDIQERKKLKTAEETTQPMPHTITKSKNPNMLPPIPTIKPTAVETLGGINPRDDTGI